MLPRLRACSNVQGYFNLCRLISNGIFAKPSALASQSITAKSPIRRLVIRMSLFLPNCNYQERHESAIVLLRHTTWGGNYAVFLYIYANECIYMPITLIEYVSDVVTTHHKYLSLTI